ncbi:MAG: AglZ/HisF2 family acetamidino modification protein [Longimicrobiales bacterium]
MLRARVIPCLLVQNRRLVKTTRFADPKYVGDPINAIRIFNDKEVDELLVLDITATRESRPPDFELVADFAEECFMPLCYGGGIRTLEDASRLFALGVEKVAIQTAAMQDLSVITAISERYGRQSVVVSVDLKRNWRGSPLLYSAARRKTLRRPWAEFVRDAVAAGAGEIIANAVHRDGTMMGMDLDLVRETAADVDVPVIAAGGVGSLEDIRAALDAGASAVGVGAFFVFHGPHRAVLITYPEYKQLEALLR